MGVQPIVIFLSFQSVRKPVGSHVRLTLQIAIEIRAKTSESPEQYNVPPLW